MKCIGVSTIAEGSDDLCRQLVVDVWPKIDAIGFDHRISDRH
jgi:hypothetical protein